jgi:hypothetical protein
VRLTSLRSLYEDRGPFSSVYLETSRASEDAKKAVPLRWRELREELEKYGADAATLDSLGDAVTGPDMTAPGGAAFGASGRALFTAKLPRPPLREQARFAALPHVMPLLAQAPPRPPYLVVSANRAGGEVLAVRTPDDAVKATVEGTGWPVHKTRVGGWAQDEHQRATEEAWGTNAKELAAAVVSAAADVQPELVVVAGDVRARGLLIDKLPTGLARKAVTVDRELDVDSGELAEATDKVLKDAAAADASSRLASYRNQLGTGRAVEGLDDTMAALRDGQAEELFLGGDYLGDDPESPGPEWSTAQAWIGPGLADIALSKDDLSERGVTELSRDRADAALIRAAAGTDASLFLVPPGDTPPQDGIGALLRYAVPNA